MTSPAVPSPAARLIALDIDGTILRSDGSLSPRTRRAVARALKAGLHVTLVTGRHLQETQHLARALRLIDPISCCNGTMIYRPDTGKIIRESTIDFTAGITATLELKRLGVFFYHYLPEGILVERRQARRLRRAAAAAAGSPFARIAQRIRRFVELRRLRLIVTEDAADYLRLRGARALMMNVPDLSEMDDQALRQNLAGALGGRVVVAYTQPYHVDILPPGRSKAAGLADVAAHLGLHPAATVAVGDNLNDLPMLEFAGLGVAMGNASAEVRAGADRVVGTNDEDGVAALIEDLLRG